MTLTVSSEPIPLAADQHGIMRVGETRVTLDSVVAVFNDGATAEEIIQQFPGLDLADVYSVLGYYLHHRAEVEAYLQEQHKLAEEFRQKIADYTNPPDVRERLTTRQKNQS